jgi:putative hydrolase of the HAD superfamily
MTTASPTFIFDVGGVFVRHDNDLLCDRLAASCADPAAARLHLAAALPREDLGTGRIGVDALHARLMAEHGFKETYPHFLELWSSHFSEEPGMEPVVRALARRHRVVLFSNTNAAHWEHVTANYPALGHAHAAYLSHELGLVKPDAASFRRVLELEGCRAEDGIFVDDRAENTAAAAALGIRAVTFTGRDDFLADLKRYGIAVRP